MKAFTIFAVLGTSGLVLTGVAANAVPEAGKSPCPVSRIPSQHTS